MFISEGKTKSRSLYSPPFTVVTKWRNHGPPPGNWNAYYSLSSQMGGIQITESDGNRWPPPKGGDLQDYGSEFFSIKKEIVNSSWNVVNFLTRAGIEQGGFDYSIVTPYIANCFETIDQGSNLGLLKTPLKFSFPPDLSSSRSQLVVKGTNAVALCQPTNQIANAATFVGELMQDVPSIPGVHLWESRLRAAEIAARASGEFLNVAFGILPTIGDMDKFLKGVHKIDKVVDQFIRDSGRVVRREFHYPTERTETMTQLDQLQPHVYSPAGAYFSTASNASFCQFAQGLGPGYPLFRTWRNRVVERDTWFSGAFTYHLPNGYDIHSKGDRRRLMAELFGAKPDLETLWNLAPWSWAVDWFSDAGSFIKNLQAHISYGSVLRYGYMMETTTITDTYTAGEPFASLTDVAKFPYPRPTPLPVTLRTTVKKRIKANPFGFGLSWDGLSPFQQAIAAALGISRVAR